MSSKTVVQSTWGLLLPILLLGDQVLDVWFLVDSWNQFLYDYIRYGLLGHLILISIIQFCYAVYWAGDNIKYFPNSGIGFQLFFGFMGFFNLTQIYFYCSRRKCCSCNYCGGQYRNLQLQEKADQLMNKQFFLHTICQDLPQLVGQVAHLITYSAYLYENDRVKWDSLREDSTINFVSVIFGAIFLGLGILHFLFCQLILKKGCGCQTCNCSISEMIIQGYCIKPLVRCGCTCLGYKSPTKMVKSTQSVSVLNLKN